jgi:hypothetical protein
LQPTAPVEQRRPECRFDGFKINDLFLVVYKNMIPDQGSQSGCSYMKSFSGLYLDKEMQRKLINEEIISSVSKLE